MFNGHKVAGAVAGLLLALAGCGSREMPQEYGRERPPMDELDERDRGLQSKDVIAATDQLAMDLLSSPDLNASKDQWTMVVMSVENKTTDPRFDYDIFIQRLRTNLSRHGRGRVTLIENRDRLRSMQNRELEQERDPFGQGGNRTQPGPAGTQPDYALYGTVSELRGRGTSYYLMEFTATNLTNRHQVWSGIYEVRVAR